MTTPFLQYGAPTETLSPKVESNKVKLHGVIAYFAKAQLSFWRIEAE